MTFLSPIGLLALVGIPVLLILFLIRPKYQELEIASTYIWRQSKKYQKNLKLVRNIIRFLLLTMQIVLVTLIALILAQPRLISSQENNEYIAILDTSASMRQLDDNGISRFDAARNAILSQCERLPISAHITLITTDPGANLLLERSNSSDARKVLNDVTCGYGEAQIIGALASAQTILDDYPNSNVFFYTDHDYAVFEGLTVVNLAKDRCEWNVVIRNLSGSNSINNTLLTHELISYGRDANITLGLFVNDHLTDAQQVSCLQDQPTEVTWFLSDMMDLSNVRIVIDEADGLQEDNQAFLLRQPSETLRVLLIGENNTYLEMALGVFSQLTFESVKTLAEIRKGYDLYIFHGCSLDILPDDGAVFLIGSDFFPEELQLIRGDWIRGTYLSQAKKIRNTANRALLTGVTASKIAVQRFLETEANDRYSTVLQCGELPAMLAGTRENGTACIILTFDLHDSNLPLLPDFISLLGNMLDYVMPDMMDSFHYNVDENITVRAVPLCIQMTLQNVDGTMQNLNTIDHTAQFSLSIPGVYTLFQDRSVGEQKYCRFSVEIPESEGDLSVRQIESTLYLSKDTGKNVENDLYPDDDINPIYWFALAIFVLLMLECVVFNRERF